MESQGLGHKNFQSKPNDFEEGVNCVNFEGLKIILTVYCWVLLLCNYPGKDKKIGYEVLRIPRTSEQIDIGQILRNLCCRTQLQL